MSKYKKVALKLWSLPEEDSSWIISKLDENQALEVTNHLKALKNLSEKPDPKLTNLVIEKYLSYSKQELELLSKLNHSNIDPQFKEIVELCLGDESETLPSHKVKLHLLQEANTKYGLI